MLHVGVFSGAMPRGWVFLGKKTLERGGESPKITPWKINMEHVLMEVWKIMFFSTWLIYRFHVILPGCRYSQTKISK